MAVRLDRETFMLMRHRKLEAYEKAYEIEIIGLNDLENEKERILKEEMERINEEYDKKRKDYETQQKIEHSTKVNMCRVTKMKKRSELLEQIVKDTGVKLAKEICVPSADYTTLIRRYILQGMIKLMEPALKVVALKKDEGLVKELLPQCQKEYEDLMMRETNKEYKCELELDESQYLENDDFGGVNLMTKDGRIVCQNTVASKLRLAYEELLPDIRALLFPADK